LRRCRVPRAFSQRPEPPLLGVAATLMRKPAKSFGWLENNL